MNLFLGVMVRWVEFVVLRCIAGLQLGVACSTCADDCASMQGHIRVRVYECMMCVSVYAYGVSAYLHGLH